MNLASPLRVVRTQDLHDNALRLATFVLACMHGSVPMELSKFYEKKKNTLGASAMRHITEWKAD